MTTNREAAAALLKIWNALEIAFPDLIHAIGDGKGQPPAERYFEVLTWTQARTDATRAAIATLLEALSAGTDLDAAATGAIARIERRAAAITEAILNERSP